MHFSPSWGKYLHGKHQMICDIEEAVYWYFLSFFSVQAIMSVHTMINELCICSKVQIQQVLRVSRGVELQTFNGEIGNIKSLLHSSSPSNFVGILSR